jgi:inhibitor of cysteine peptidase
MKMNTGTITVTIAFLAFLFLCLQPATASLLRFDLSDNGAVVPAAMNDFIVINLPENPSTGYMWDAEATTGLYLKSDTYNRPATMRMGAGGSHTWNYVVTGTGTQEFSAVYHQPWMPIDESDMTYSLTFELSQSSRSDLLTHPSSGTSGAVAAFRAKLNL